jgi:hypothetical protein
MASCERAMTRCVATVESVGRWAPPSDSAAPCARQGTVPYRSPLRGRRRWNRSGSAANNTQDARVAGVHRRCRRRHVSRMWAWSLHLSHVQGSVPAMIDELRSATRRRSSHSCDALAGMEHRGLCRGLPFFETPRDHAGAGIQASVAGVSISATFVRRTGKEATQSRRPSPRSTVWGENDQCATCSS